MDIQGSIFPFFCYLQALCSDLNEEDPCQRGEGPAGHEQNSVCMTAASSAPLDEHATLEPEPPLPPPDTVPSDCCESRVQKVVKVKEEPEDGGAPTEQKPAKRKASHTHTRSSSTDPTQSVAVVTKTVKTEPGLTGAVSMHFFRFFKMFIDFS